MSRTYIYRDNYSLLDIRYVHGLWYMLFLFSPTCQAHAMFRGGNRDSQKAPAGPELGLAKQAFEAHSTDSTSWSVHLLVMSSLLVNLDRHGIWSCLLSVTLVFLWKESFFFFYLYASLMTGFFFFLGLGSPISYFRLLSSLACVQPMAPVSFLLLLLICTETCLLALILAASLIPLFLPDVPPSLSRPRPSGSAFSFSAVFTVPIKRYFHLQTPCRM